MLRSILCLLGPGGVVSAMMAADDKCDELRAHAVAALDPLPDNLRDRLLEVTQYLIARTV